MENFWTIPRKSLNGIFELFFFQIIQLKIEHNPFAKGFRHNGKHELRKRKLAEAEAAEEEKGTIFELDAPLATSSPKKAHLAAPNSVQPDFTMLNGFSAPNPFYPQQPQIPQMPQVVNPWMFHQAAPPAIPYYGTAPNPMLNPFAAMMLPSPHYMHQYRSHFPPPFHPPN